MAVADRRAGAASAPAADATPMGSGFLHLFRLGFGSGQIITSAVTEITDDVNGTDQTESAAEGCQNKHRVCRNQGQWGGLDEQGKTGSGDR